MIPSRPMEIPIGARSKTSRNLRSDSSAAAIARSSSPDQTRDAHDDETCSEDTETGERIDGDVSGDGLLDDRRHGDRPYGDAEKTPRRRACRTLRHEAMTKRSHRTDAAPAAPASTYEREPAAIAPAFLARSSMSAPEPCTTCPRRAEAALSLQGRRTQRFARPARRAHAGAPRGARGRCSG